MLICSLYRLSKFDQTSHNKSQIGSFLISGCTHHLEGLGDPGSEHANTEEDEKSGAEADGGDDADTEGLAALQMTGVKTNDDIVMMIMMVVCLISPLWQQLERRTLCQGISPPACWRLQRNNSVNTS